MQRHRRGAAMPIVLVLVVAALVAPAAPAAAQLYSSERVLRVGVPHDAERLNPAYPGNDVDREITRLQFAGLTSRSIPDLSVVPDLAESWQVSADGLTVTYTLRRDLRWSDGTSLTAADVVFTLERAREERWPAYVDAVEHLRAEERDDRHVVVTSEVPDPRLPALDVPVLPRHVYGSIDADALADHQATDGVGSGPYVLTENEPGARRGLVRNTNWWGPAPFVERIDLLVYPDTDALLGALESGDLDFASGLPASAFARISTAENVTTVAGRAAPVVVLVPDTSAASILADRDVRRAVDLAVDRAAIAEEVAGGLFTPLARLPVSLVPPPWPPDEQTATGTGARPDAAARALEDAGHTGDAEPPRLRVAPLPGWPDRATRALADSLRGAGFEVEVVERGEGADLEVHELDVTPEPLTMLRRFACAGGADDDPVTWCDAGYDATFEQYVASSADERDALVERLSATIADELPVVTLYQHNALQGYRIERFTDWTRQPRRYGPVLFSGTVMPYTRLAPSPIYSPPGSRRKMLLAVAGGAVVAMAAGIGGLVMWRRATPTNRRTS